MTDTTKNISVLNKNNSKIISINDLLLKPLKIFYSNPDNLSLFINILNKVNICNKNSNNEKKISLRLIDWFVTNYCKKNKIIIKCFNKNSNKLNYIDVYDSYKSNLKAFSKQIFDPFRRKNNIILIYNNSNNLSISFVYNLKDVKKSSQNLKFIDTTIGQLNFFKWIIEINAYNYICKFRDIIENDMNKSQNNQDNKKYITKTIKEKNGNTRTIVRKKRNELSKPISNKSQTIKNKKEKFLVLSFD
jgi:hypothetical protein